MRRIVAIMIVALGLMAAPAVAQSKVTIGDMFHAPALVTPHRLSLWASDSLLDLRWSGWGKATVTATGKVSAHAYGHWRYSPTKVTASQLGRCHGHTIYTRLRYTRDGRWHDAHLFHCRFVA
jgi:hypothetical protein